MTIQDLTAAAKLACQALSRLTALTELRVLGAQRHRMPWLLQPAKPLPHGGEVGGAGDVFASDLRGKHVRVAGSKCGVLAQGA